MEKNSKNSPKLNNVKEQSDADADNATAKRRPKEIGGRQRGLDPTRYGDWEKNGRCIDF